MTCSPTDIDYPIAPADVSLYCGGQQGGVASDVTRSNMAAAAAAAAATYPSLAGTHPSLAGTHPSQFLASQVKNWLKTFL